LQVLDSFISLIPGFEGDILILVILISTQSPSGESEGDSMTGASAVSLRTRVGKCKASATPPLQKKAKKVVGKKPGGIKINDPVPKSSTAQLLQRPLEANSPCVDPTSKSN
jgi:hypothetical protein